MGPTLDRTGALTPGRLPVYLDLATPSHCGNVPRLRSFARTHATQTQAQSKSTSWFRGGLATNPHPQPPILSDQKAPAGRGSKYNFICPKGPCGTTFCYSQKETYDIGTEIIFFHCFATKIINSFYESIILEDYESFRRDLAFYSIKT